MYVCNTDVVEPMCLCVFMVYVCNTDVVYRTYLSMDGNALKMCIYLKQDTLSSILNITFIIFHFLSTKVKNNHKICTKLEYVKIHLVRLIIVHINAGCSRILFHNHIGILYFPEYKLQL